MMGEGGGVLTGVGDGARLVVYKELAETSER